MELINKKISEQKEFNILSNSLKNISENKNPNISYNNFKNLIIKVMTYIMEEYIKQSNLTEDETLKEASFTIKELPNYLGGVFANGNKIIINENVIKKIYNGDLFSLKTIFHEFNHFKVNCDLINNIPDICLYRILKEKFLYLSTRTSWEEIKHQNSTGYYDSNYHLYSEEIYVEIKALDDYLKFLEITSISLPREIKNKIKQKLDNLVKKWNNHIRDLTYAINFNSNKLDFYEAFDLEIKYHKKWLKDAPLFEVEYYQDEFGKINKRTTDELIELLTKEKNKEKSKLILELIISRYEKEAMTETYSIKKINK